MDTQAVITAALAFGSGSLVPLLTRWFSHRAVLGRAQMGREERTETKLWDRVTKLEARVEVLEREKADALAELRAKDVENVRLVAELADARETISALEARLSIRRVV